MAESKEASPMSDLPLTPFLEVMCKSSGIARRFAPGTKTGFALTLINGKLDVGAPAALYIEAVKDGEEPVCFGPSSVLLSYGSGWKLQTVVDGLHVPGAKKREGVQAFNKSVAKRQVSEPAIDFLYIGKILLVFLFIFLLGAIFTLTLENMPRLLLLFNSSL